MIIEGLVILLLLLLFPFLLSLHFQVTSIHRNVGLRNSNIHVSQGLRILPAGLDRRTDKELRSLSMQSISFRSVGKIGGFDLTDRLVHSYVHMLGRQHNNNNSQYISQVI